MESVFTSTTHLANAIREKHISAVEVIEAHLAQIERYNPVLNAVVTLDATHARERAQAADKALSHGEVWGPLHGVPFTLKDAHATAGVRTTSGSTDLDHVPSADGTVAARLKAAGGILLGKTNVPPLLGDFQTANPLFGQTNNPWNTERTSGGSSGGAAAAVASGMTPFDVGTDLSGSIRLPAHFCGVLGLKPTEHRVSLDGILPGLPPPPSVRILSCVGPLARTVEDLALVFSLIAGPDRRDADVPPVPVGALPTCELKALHVAVAPAFAGLPVAEALRSALQQLTNQLQPLCAVVAEPALPVSDFPHELMDFAALLNMVLNAFPPDEQNQPSTLAQYLEAVYKRDQSMFAWERFFDEWDVLVCPPAMMTAFPHCPRGTPLVVDGSERDYNLVSAYPSIFNYTGHPAVVLPYQRDQEGLPLGIQLVGRRWDEMRLLAIAQSLSAVTGPFQSPPGY
jgi:amidase